MRPNAWWCVIVRHFFGRSKGVVAADCGEPGGCGDPRSVEGDESGVHSEAWLAHHSDEEKATP